MAIPTSRKTFRDYCIRALGDPVVPISLDDDQIDDRIDEALQWFWDWHYDGSERLYMAYRITAEDKVNKYITLPDAVIGVVRILDMGNSSANTLFNVRYQLALNDLWDLSGTSLIPYYLARRHIEMFNDFFAQQPQIVFNRHKNQLQLLMDWDMLLLNQYIVVECHRILDPNEFTKVWNDRWLKEFAIALLKQQQAIHLKKITMALPGGVTYNGQQEYDEAVADIARLKQELYDSSLIPMDIIG